MLWVLRGRRRTLGRWSDETSRTLLLGSLWAHARWGHVVRLGKGLDSCNLLEKGRSSACWLRLLSGCWRLLSRCLCGLRCWSRRRWLRDLVRLECRHV